MGRNAPLYSDDQREAIAHAVLDRGLTARQAVEQAAAGELGVSPFRVPLSTAQGFVTQARRDQPPGGPADEKGRLRQLADRALVVIEMEMTKVEASSQRGSLDLPRIKRTLQAAQHLARLEQLLATPRPAPSDQQALASQRFLEQMQRNLEAERAPSQGNGTVDEGADLRARLEAELRATAENAEAETPHPNGHPAHNGATDNRTTPV